MILTIAGGESVISIPKLQVNSAGWKSIEGTTASGEVANGEACCWTVVGPPGVELELVDVAWGTGERDVRLERAICPLPSDIGEARPLARLLRGGRLSVLQSGQVSFVELQVGRIDPESPVMWSTTHKGTEEDFVSLAGEDWVACLANAGADRVGERERILGDSGRRRGYLGATWHGLNHEIPVAAYLLTRVLPLLDVWSSVHEQRMPLPNQRRAYVIELAGNSLEPPEYYVGETGRTPEERLDTHLQGGRTAARIVARRGGRLVPDLYEHVPPVGDPDRNVALRKGTALEVWLADALRARGCEVHGATRGLHEAPFVTGD